ncbi:hypothetical protein KFU94_53945 [Chloroflexi bacterium TSY]|nr:hypothetical protein [Chloroflexi bacterium TSY]
MEFDFLSIVVWAIVGGILGSLIGILFQDGRFDLSGDVIGSLIGGIGGGLAFEWMVGDISSLVGSSLAASIGALIFLLLLRLTGTQPHDRTDDAMTQLDNQINLENGGGTF